MMNIKVERKAKKMPTVKVNLLLGLFFAVVMQVVEGDGELLYSPKREKDILTLAVKERSAQLLLASSTSSQATDTGRGLVIVNEKYVLDTPIQTPYELTSPMKNLVPWETYEQSTMLNDKFILHNRFSRGGCGEVWFAKDLRDKTKRFVLKRVFSDKVLSGMREVYFGERLRGNSRVTRFVEAFNRTNSDGEPELWLVFEDEGTSLKNFLYEFTPSGTVEPSNFWKKLRETGQKGNELRREIARQLVLGLNSLAIQHIVHRDVKPGNILITAGGTTASKQVPVKIGDFGSAIDTISYRQGLFGPVGATRKEHTRIYEPPEFASFDDTHAFVDLNFYSSFDVWSLGVVLLEILLGTDRVFELADAVKRKKNRRQTTLSITETTSNFVEQLLDFGVDDVSRFNDSVQYLDPFKRGFFDDVRTGHLELDFVFNLLRLNPSQRLSLEQALAHPYLTSQSYPDENDDGPGCAKPDKKSPILSDIYDTSPASVTFRCGKCGRDFSNFGSCDSHAKARGHSSMKLDTSHPERSLCLVPSTSMPLDICSPYTVLEPCSHKENWCGNAGSKIYSEDFYSASDNVYIVLDGHFGEEAARFVGKHLLETINKLGEDLFADFSNADQLMQRAFLEVHHMFLSKYPNVNSGTAVATLVMHASDESQHLMTANVGDVRVIICCDKAGEPKVLTEDHHAADPQEKLRVESLGGNVSFVNGRMRLLGKLALTRSLGDRQFLPYVSATPHVNIFNVSRSQKQWRFAVIGTDGLFDAISNVDVAKIVWMEMIRSEALVFVDHSNTHEEVDEANVAWFARASKRLVFEARSRGVTLDNVGVAVVPI
jgi:serine/threonine protein kinase